MSDAAHRGGADSSGPSGAGYAGSGPTQRLTVALVDDHHLLREGLRLVLEAQPGIEVIGEAASQAEAFTMLAHTTPDVLILDMTFPDGDGLSLLKDLATLYPQVRIVVLTMHRDAETVRQALAAGAAAYVVKGAHSGELVQAIQAVARGERYIHSSVTDVIVNDSLQLMRAEGPLTLREREILGLIGSGMSAGQIGDTLGISRFTVRRHVANISAKLGVTGSGALTRYAVEHGLVRDR